MWLDDCVTHVPGTECHLCDWTYGLEDPSDIVSPLAMRMGYSSSASQERLLPHSESARHYFGSITSAVIGCAVDCAAELRLVTQRRTKTADRQSPPMRSEHTAGKERDRSKELR